VTLSASAGGVSSTSTPSFDNCSYLQAVAASSGPAAVSYTLTVPVVNASVGGNVSGLNGSLTLQNDQSDPLTLSSNGPFTFGRQLRSGNGYNVIVAAQPAHEACTVSNGSGTVSTANIDDMQVVCAPVQEDVTQLMTLSRTGFVPNRATGTFNLQVTLTNSSAMTLAAPLWLVVSGLPTAASLYNATGTSFPGAPYILVPPPAVSSRQAPRYHKPSRS
jgi:hypothetical protein